MRILRLTANAPIGKPGRWGPRFLESHYARRLEGALSVQEQLAWVAECNSALARLEFSELFSSHNRGMTAAVAISYRQCFNDGSRKYRLTSKHVAKAAGHSLALHNQLMTVANKAVAHADSWLDRVCVAMSINEHGEFAGLHTQHLQATVLRKEEHAQLESALLGLGQVIQADIEELKLKCVSDAEALSPQQRLAADEVTLGPPTNSTDGIAP